jgi:hypothetical protein
MMVFKEKKGAKIMGKKKKVMGKNSKWNYGVKNPVKLNQAESERNRDKAIAAAEKHADSEVSEWTAKALGYVEAYPYNTFVTEDVRAWAYENGFPQPPNERSWGGVIRRAKNIGMIKHTGKTGNARNPKAHRGITNIWIKL